MAAEQPAIAAVVARLPDSEINLAAYGGVVFPISLVIEAPIIMLLAASTELSRDRASYRALRSFTHRAGFALTVLHLLVAATPLYELVVLGVLGVPDAVAEHGRIGLLLTLPWTWSIAARRMGQGVLIRFGRSRAVGLATGIRLVSSASILGAGLVWQELPGIVVGAAALSVGVLCEAGFVAILVRRVVAEHLEADDPEHPPLRGRAFWAFYVPLAMMPLIALILQPIGTAAISRMPNVVASLAVWPVVNSILFVMQASGIAYNEVVVAQLERPGAKEALGRFTWMVAGGLTLLWGALAFTPLRELWFGAVAGLSPELAGLAITTAWIALPVPGSRVVQSWYQGILVRERQTRGVTEAVLVFAVVCAGILIAGAKYEFASGLAVALIGVSAGRVAQTVWLAWRVRMVRRNHSTEGARTT